MDGPYRDRAVRAVRLPGAGRRPDCHAGAAGWARLRKRESRVDGHRVTGSMGGHAAVAESV